MDSRKFTLPLNYEDFDPDYDQEGADKGSINRNRNSEDQRSAAAGRRQMEAVFETIPGEESENGSDKEGVGAASDDKKAADDKRAAVAGKSDGAAGKAAKMMDSAEAAQLKRSRKMMNVALVVLLVVGVGLYLNSKMRSSSSNDAAGEL
nr:inactive protein RESTRICTED TEV MOVEMENT 2-like [Ipomoea batatas]